MKEKGQKKTEQYYTYTEFKEKFFPNLNLDEYNNQFSKETFLDVLRKVNKPTKQSTGKTQPVQTK